MCQACNHEEEEPQEEFTIDMIPEEDREEFLDYAVQQFTNVIDKADSNGILFEMATEWSRPRCAMFTMATIVEHRMLDADED